MDYTFHCESPRCGQITPVAGKQLEFLRSRAERGMTLAMTACPVCMWSQPFNPLAADGKMPAKKVQQLPKGEPTPTLPSAYLPWLASLGRQRHVTFADREWELATAKQLDKQVNIDGRRARYVEQARLFALSLAEYVPHAVDAAGNRFPLARVGQFLSLGSDNEDLLCVDPSDAWSVWCFAPGEGAMVERLAKTLDQFMKSAGQ
jgi:hypothetical protein